MQASSAAPAMGGEQMSSSSIDAVTLTTGSHVLKIGGYSRTKKLGNGAFIESSEFHVGGHRWCIKYYPDGHTSYNAGWISFFLKLQHTDAKADVEASFKISLLDEMGEPVQSYSKAWAIPRPFKTADADSTWGYAKFIENKVLEESTYLQDDCFRIRCDIVVEKVLGIQRTKQFVTVPPSDMNKHIGSLLSSGQEADVTFQIGEETVPAHRLILGARSSVFMAELFGPMKEKHAKHVQIHDMEPRVFKAMLHFVYTDTMEDIDMEDALVITQHLLVAADRYDLERLKLMCEDKLCEFIDTSTVATTLALAEQHGCPGLKKACFNFLELPSHLKEVMENEGFDHLMSSCPSVIKELLAKVAHCPDYAFTLEATKSETISFSDVSIV